MCTYVESQRCILGGPGGMTPQGNFIFLDLIRWYLRLF